MMLCELQRGMCGLGLAAAHERVDVIDPDLAVFRRVPEHQLEIRRSLRRLIPLEVQHAQMIVGIDMIPVDAENRRIERRSFGVFLLAMVPNGGLHHAVDVLCPLRFGRRRRCVNRRE
nr:hypothetical protein [Paraburkholderia bannensis]